MKTVSFYSGLGQTMLLSVAMFKWTTRGRSGLRVTRYEWFTQNCLFTFQLCDGQRTDEPTDEPVEIEQPEANQRPGIRWQPEFQQPLPSAADAQPEQPHRPQHHQQPGEDPVHHLLLSDHHLPALPLPQDLAEHLRGADEPGQGPLQALQETFLLSALGPHRRLRREVALDRQLLVQLRHLLPGRQTLPAADVQAHLSPDRHRLPTDQHGHQRRRP